MMLSLAVAIAGTAPMPHFISPGDYPHGLASDGTHLWHTEHEGRRIHQLTSAGEIIRSFPFSAANPRGIEYHDGQLYVATATRIYRVNSETGASLSSFASPLGGNIDHQGLAMAGDRLWIATRGSGNARIYAANPNTGALQASIPAPGPNPRGLAYHDGLLWCLESSGGLLHAISPDDGEIISSHPIPVSGPRGLAWHDGQLHMVGLNERHITAFTSNSGFSSVYISDQRFPTTTGGHTLELPYTSSHPLDIADASIRRILVCVHGIDDNAASYFARALLAAELAGVRHETLVVCPQFLNADKLIAGPPADLIYWATSNPRFWGALSAGSSATFPRPFRISSYALLDELLDSLIDGAGLFPNLREIVISGHSGGGQFVNRYAISSPFGDHPALQARGIDVCYIVMNPSTYAYFDDTRYVPEASDIATRAISFATPANPPANHDNWGYGIGGNFYSYHGGATAADLRARYAGRKVIYLAGGADTGSNNLATEPRAMLQGENRYERAVIYYAHLKNHFASEALRRHRFAVVPGVGHSSRGMLTSDVGLRHYFQQPPRIHRIRHIHDAGQPGLSIDWIGFDGTATLESSLNLADWQPLDVIQNSPHLLAPPHPSRAFFRLTEAPGP